VGLDDDGGYAAAAEDVLVGLEHLLVAHVQALPVGVEAVEVLHAELAQADDAAPRPRLVPELGLDLVDQDGQVAIALDVTLEEVHGDLLVGGAQRQVAVAAVLEDEEVVAERLSPP